MKKYRYLQLNDAPWAYEPAFKTLLGISRNQQAYEKHCNLYVELEHKTYCTLKVKNSNIDDVGQLNEFKNGAHENLKFYETILNIFITK